MLFKPVIVNSPLNTNEELIYILLNHGGYCLIWCDFLCKLNRSLSLLEASLKSCCILRGWVLYSRFRCVHGTLKFLIGDGMNGVYKRLIQLVHYTGHTKKARSDLSDPTTDLKQSDV